MSATESVLRVLLSQAQLELAQAMAAAAVVRDRAAQAEGDTMQAQVRCDAITDHIRRIEIRSRLDPVLLGVSRQVHRSEGKLLRQLQIRMTAAKADETRAIEAVAGLRSRERALEAALKLQRRKRRQARQAADALLADELWLQRSRTEGP